MGRVSRAGSKLAFSILLIGVSVSIRGSGTWVATGDMAAPRASHGAFLLADGRVFVAADINNGGAQPPNLTTEFFDPASGSWSPDASATLNHSDASSVRLADGRVLVAGGRYGSSPLGTSEIYDPATHAWSATGSMQHRRVLHTLTLLPNGKVLAAGGYGDFGFDNTAELFDPATNTWSFTGSFAGGYGRWQHAATLMNDGRVLVTGGENYGYPGIAMPEAQYYDPATGTWSMAPNLPQPRLAHRAALLRDGRVIVVGGVDTGAGIHLATTAIFNGTSWTTGASMAQPRDAFPLTVLSDGTLLVTGGRVSFTPVYTANAERYDPVANTWTSAGAMTSVRASHSATELADGRVLVAGGYNGSVFLKSAELLVNDITAPTTTATPSIGPNGNGWNNTDVVVTLQATDTGGSGVQSIAYSLAGAQSGSGTIAGSSGTVTLSAEGTTTLTYHAADGVGNVEADHSLVVRIDKTPPTIAALPDISVGATSSAGAVVTFTPVASDALSGIASTSATPRSSGMVSPLGTTNELVTTFDAAGNSASTSFTVTVNPSRPIINVMGGTFTFDGNPHPATATATDVANNPVGGSFTFSYQPGGTAPVSPGRYSATASFASNDPAFTNAFPWTTKASDPHAKNSPAVTAINGKLYVQGFDQDPNGSQSSFVPRLGIYDPFSNTWTDGASPSLIRAYASAVTINGKMYVVGGCVMSDCRIGVQGARVLEIYDPGSNTWTTGAHMPTGRYGAAAGVINGKLYVAGGVTECPPCVPTTVTEIYDPVSNGWTSGAPIPTSRELSASAVSNGLLYVIGGYERGAVNASVGAVSVYDPIANNWSTRSPMPTPRTAAAAAVVNGEIYVIGGVGSNAPLAVSESFDPQSDKWTPRQPMTTARTNVSAGVVNSTAYVIDGFNNGLRTENEAYDASLSAIITINPGDTTPPTTNANYPAPNANGWNRFNVHVNLNAFDSGGSAPPSGVQSITYALTGAETGGGTFIGNNTQFDITTEGTTTVTYHATDNRGNVEADHTFTVKLDKTPPTAASLGNITTNATSTSGAVVTFNLAPADALSGVDTVVFTQGLPSGSTFPHGTTNESVTITDKAGNSTFRSFSVTVNKTLLSIAVSPSSPTVKTGHQTPPFMAMGHFTQGPDQMLPTSGGGGGGGGGSSSNQLLWDVFFAGVTPSGGMALNVDACATTPVAGGFSSQVLATDVATGAVIPTLWEPGNEIVQVVGGQITPTQVNVSLRCKNSSATASFSGTWNGTRYVGTYTDFAGHSDTATVSAHSLMALSRTDTQLQIEWGANGNTSFTVDYLDPSYFGTAQPTCADFPPHSNIFETTSDPAIIGGLQPSTWYHIHVHPLDASHHPIGSSTNVIIVRTRAAGSGVESLWPGSADYMICGGGGSSGGGGGSSLPTVTWQSTNPSIATINGSGVAAGVSAGQTTIVATAAGVSCETTNSCATLTVIEPPHITLTLAPGSQSFASVQVTTVNPATGATFGPFDVPFGAPQEVDAGQIRLLFAVPAGYTVTPTQIDLDLHNGDNVTVPLFFAFADTTPPTLTVPPDQTAEATSSAGANVGFPAATATDGQSGVRSVGCDRTSGDLFPIGQTVVHCSATDNANNTANGSFTVTVRDTTPPRVSCGSPDGAWHATDVAIACTATDAVGLLNASDASFSLSTSVAAGDETAAAATNSRAICDQYGNCATAGPIGLNRIDRKGPAIVVSPDKTAEATGSGGATVSFAAATATDGGSGVQSVSCDRVSGDVFPLGATTVHCMATDNVGNATPGSFVVTVVDTTGPVVTTPGSISLEAAGPNGTPATFNASALDAVDGGRQVTCSPASGSTFPIGVTQVTCTASDTRGNSSQRSFNVFVQDTVPPVVRVLRPAPDDVLPFAPATVTVEVEVMEAVGVSQVFINNVRANPSSGTLPVTRWIANVPAQPDGVAFTAYAIAYDTSFRFGQTTSITDNDGIAASIDRNRATFADESDKFSSDFFANGGTPGTIGRGPGARVTAVPSGSGVKATLQSGGRSTVSFCSGSKYLVLDTPGESADITCGGSTVTVKAYTTNKIELFKWTNGIKYVTQFYCQWISGGFFSRGHSFCFPVPIPVSYQYWYQIDLGPGQQVSTGSPVTASPDNTEPVHVTLLQINDDDTQIPVAGFDLDPGESADVAIVQGDKREDQLDFVALAGSVTVSIGGVTQTIGEGQHSTLHLDNTPPVIAVPGNLVREATSAAGAVVTFTATATDNVDGPIPVTCATASGSTFAIGTTTVECSAMDIHGNPASGTFTVTVQDTTPPTLTVPANITKPATSFAGAAVTFSATATDLVDGARPVTCTPASGSTFPIGTTTVVCTAADTRSHSASRTFTVTITFTFQQGRTFLQQLIANVKSGNTAAVCSDLAGIITIIQSQVGVHLTQAEANTLIKLANDARNALKCS